MDQTNGYVHTENIAGKGIITFYHPQSNSMPSSLLRALADAVRRAGEDPGIKVIIVQSAGEKSFCAGASFDELSAIRTEAEGLAFFSGFALVINAMRTCPKLIIGRVQGKCVGGGVGLAAATDYCLASDKADIKLSELAVGIGPFVVGPAVERKIGTSAFSQLAIDATGWRSASWAREKGLFADIFPDIRSLDDAVNALAERLCASHPEAMAELKAVFWTGTDHWDSLLAARAAISGRLVLSDFSREAIARFKNRN
jgi:methylglutaconyl-CoA hydratase